MIDWRTDEGNEAVWETPLPTAVSPGWLRRRGWRFWLLLLCSLGLVGAVVAMQWAARVEQTIEAARLDVRQHHELAWQAAVANDIDLYTLLLPTGGDWRAHQRVLLRAHLLTDRAPLLLWLDKTAVSPAPTFITLSPDFNKARVETIQPYLTRTAAGAFEPIGLRQTAVYARYGSGWRLASTDNDADFWGKTLINRDGALLQIVYPERDKGVARRLGADLDELVQNLCAHPALHCAPDAIFRLTLSPDTVSLYSLQDNPLTLTVRSERDSAPFYHVRLPTPTLVGYPVDEAAYAALRRGYAGWLTAVLVQSLAVEPLSITAVQAQLAAFDLQLPPVAAWQPLAVAAPPQSLPSTPLLVSCFDGVRAQTWQYFPEQDVWQRLELRVLPPPPSPVDTATIGVVAEQTLLAAVPRSQRPLTLEIVAFLGSEFTGRESALILAQAGEQQDVHYLFATDGSSGGTRFLGTLSRRGTVQQPLQMGGNGRYLVWPGQGRHRSYLTLFDLEAGEEQVISWAGGGNGRYHWSADGQWLVLVEDRALRFLLPVHQYEAVMPHPLGGCTHAQWAE